MIPNNYLTEKTEIESQIQKLQNEVLQLQKRHRGPALQSIVKAMQEYEIEPEEVASAYRQATRGGRGARRTSNLPPKYRDPASGQTWSGRGRTPRWLSEAEESGRSRDDYLIK